MEQPLGLKGHWLPARLGAAPQMPTVKGVSVETDLHQFGPARRIPPPYWRRTLQHLGLRPLPGDGRPCTTVRKISPPA
jgi:hypothetical protein